MKRDIKSFVTLTFLFDSKVIHLISFFGFFPTLLMGYFAFEESNMAYLSFSILLLITIVIVVMSRIKILELMSYGTITKGAVLNLEKLNLYCSPKASKNRKSVYKVTTSYQTDNGELLQNVSNQGKRKFKDNSFPKIGEKVEIIYDPDSPELSKRMDLYFDDFRFSEQSVTLERRALVAKLLLPILFIFTQTLIFVWVVIDALG